MHKIRVLLTFVRITVPVMKEKVVIIETTLILCVMWVSHKIRVLLTFVRITVPVIERIVRIAFIGCSSVLSFFYARVYTCA